MSSYRLLRVTESRLSGLVSPTVAPQNGPRADSAALSFVPFNLHFHGPKFEEASRLTE